MKHTTSFAHPAVPPSLNRVGGHSNWQVWRRHKQEWQGVFEMLLLVAKVPRGLAWVQMEAELRFPVHRRRDEGNFRALLEKACGDGLVNGGWLFDDVADLYSFTALRFDREVGAPRTTFLLVYETKED